jgi:cytoskeletal protein RodZ
MGKHEIRLRKQRITARGSERFRNYSSVLKQHEEEKKIKILVRIFTFFLIIAALILLIVVVTRWEQKQEKPIYNPPVTKVIKQDPSQGSKFKGSEPNHKQTLGWLILSLLRQ